MADAFGITGIGTMTLAWVVAVLAVAAVTIGWARLAGRGVGAVIARVLAQLLVVVLVALAVGVSVNRSGLWFVSWRDLGSVFTEPSGGEMRELGSSPADAASADLGPWGPRDAAVVASDPPTPDPHTDLVAYRVTGPASGYTGTVYARVPDGADQRGGDTTVVQVFHGYPVSAQSAYVNLAIGAQVDEYLNDPIVLVPDWSPGELDTECVDGPAGAMETWLTTDIPAWAVATLGATPDRGSWATFGYSAGGWCATMAAMRHPSTYAAAISLGGYTRPLFSSHYEPFPPEGGPYDLPLLARDDPPAVALLVQYSARDHYAAPSSDDLLAATRPPLSVTHWDTPDVGHRVGAWKPLVPDALTWLTRTARAFA
ncbi:MAG: alpha/beta hydrolase-fold protein [Mobilicoccus sp.]|nr:alpha/beta hydrolase-fold protein [Mobilicoccus sp.]